jgi:hypothetical protein
MPDTCATGSEVRLTPDSTWVSVLVFILHQFMGTWGVALLGPYLGMIAFELIRFFNRSFSMRSIHWILTETPYFPMQICFGLYCGWLLGRRIPQRYMTWVWILPAFLLSYCVVFVPTINPQLTPMLYRPEGPLSHYFGWGCNPQNRCLDQILVTLPFYSSAAYSLGAWLAWRTLIRSKLGNLKAVDLNEEPRQ